MIEAILQREKSTDSGTLGNLDFSKGGRIFLSVKTIELPWRDNQRRISCIPEGVYKVIWSRSSRFKVVLPELLKVPKRSGIRIHKGNWAGDSSLGYPCQSQGCILIGLQHGSRLVDGRQQLEVLKSAAAMDMLQRTLEGEGFNLVTMW